MAYTGGEFFADFKIKEIREDEICLHWEKYPGAGVTYRLYWSDRDTPDMQYRCIYFGEGTEFSFRRSTHIPHYFRLFAVTLAGQEIACGSIKTPVRRIFHEQLEHLLRGLVAMCVDKGIFLSWRLMKSEVDGYTETGLSGVDFDVVKNGEIIARVCDSTNYLDVGGTINDVYQVRKADMAGSGEEGVSAFPSGENYYDIPICRPEGGVTPDGEVFSYHANDMSVGDVDGDGDYEYIVKWDPDNSKDVSQKGYTGHCILDCYKFDGRLLFRIDLGPNIRAGAHYTQFMVFDFDGNGRAEISVKTAPGSRVLRPVREEEESGSDICPPGDYEYINGQRMRWHYITLPQKAVACGVSHTDNYVCSREDYREHMALVFMDWKNMEEVRRGEWPSTLEECFGIPPEKEYPLSRKDALWLADYFIHQYAPSRSERNMLWDFCGFVYTGPEFLTMFYGDGREAETIDFPFPRIDDGLRWGDYAMERIEPCNRVDRFLSGVAYLDGEHPSLIVCRGYYTRTCIAAYDFKGGRHRERFIVDSGFVPMKNPFCDHPHSGRGSDPVYGALAGQGNHSLSTADIDGDGFQEIIYGAAVIDHDGSLKYSSFGKLPDKREAKLGHGDAIHVAKIDPDRPGYEIFHVFEGGEEAPYGYALCDAETGEVLWGKYVPRDLGRCMVGSFMPDVRGLQCFVNEVFDCRGRKLCIPAPGTNQSVRFAADLSTQFIDGADYVKGAHDGIVGDPVRGVLLVPKDVRTNNGTKGNPCLVADILGDFREEILYRRADDNAIRIYFADEVTKHKLYTLMHDTMYRTGVAWQNNCYNQPCYTKFYLAPDMEWEMVLE